MIARLLCVTVLLSLLTGCRESQKKKELLVVEFKPETTLRYKFVSERDITLELKSDDPKMQDKNKPQKMAEKLELVIAYKPVEVDPFGLTVIEATCESAQVTRRNFTAANTTPDAAQQLAGKTFTIKLSPSGKITDYSSLTEIVQRLGEQAFTGSTTGSQKIKNPDMIYDFIAMQWYLWDSVATIDKPLDGVKKGTTWTADQLIPLPVPMIAARKTTYTFNNIMETPEGRKAIINSEYELTKAKLENWPKPYAESFAMKGMFGFLRNYQYQSVEGTGKQIFNIDSGTVESDRQHYIMTMTAAFMLPLGDSVPVITLDQKITTELLD
ncbi:MAG: hypothetical protein IH624_15185 [Phycisphaerae bacterium]|nr:hypothetical protein [Phycisphaerae bacterium]